MYDKKEHKQTHLKRNPLRWFSIKRLFALIFLLCQTLGIIRISTQASTTFKSKSPVSELARTLSIISTITWFGYQNTESWFSEVV